MFFNEGIFWLLDVTDREERSCDPDDESNGEDDEKYVHDPMVRESGESAKKNP